MCQRRAHPSRNGVHAAPIFLARVQHTFIDTASGANLLESLQDEDVVQQTKNLTGILCIADLPCALRYEICATTRVMCFDVSLLVLLQNICVLSVIAEQKRPYQVE
jgi:hypothetical protein